MNELIIKAVEIVGTQSELAVRCRVSQQAVKKWLNGGEYSAKYAARIEQATQGVVTARDLCVELDRLDKQVMK